MAKVRAWLNWNPWAAPYRALRDILRVSANRRELLEQLRQTLESIQRLEHEAKRQIDEHALKLAVQRTELDRQLETQRARLDRLERLEYQSNQQQHVHAQALTQLAPLYKTPALPFSRTQAAPAWIENAEALLGQRLADLPADQHEHWLYSFYSEMAGGVGHILEQQYQVYLPLLPRLAGCRVLDIGCGAGEFLRFLRSHDIPAIGIDLDAHEVQRATEQGLTAVHAQATDYLAHSTEHYAAISLLQVIEHVPPAQVRPLLAACANALAPGGVLLVETINLRNPNALNGFYTDPTHQVPLSDNYLSFVLQWNQLERVEFIYTLPEWLAGISSDDRSRCYANYTVIGYRPA